MRDLARPLLLLTLVMLVPVAPFVGFGPAMEQTALAWLSRPEAPGLYAAMVVGLLATDILLPIPSSVISTLGGAQLGAVGGTLASLAGMTIGATLGFFLATRWGQPLAARFARPEQLVRLEEVMRQYGPLVVVAARAVPVLAEASVLLAGMHRLSWRRFLPAVVLANFCVAAVYSIVGAAAKQHQWMTGALAVSIVLPVILTLAAGRWLPK